MLYGVQQQRSPRQCSFSQGSDFGKWPVCCSLPPIHFWQVSCSPLPAESPDRILFLQLVSSMSLSKCYFCHCWPSSHWLTSGGLGGKWKEGLAFTINELPRNRADVSCSLEGTRLEKCDVVCKPVDRAYDFLNSEPTYHFRCFRNN